MARLVAVVFSVALVCACHKEVSYDPPEKGPQLAVPPFRIEIAFGGCRQELRDAHETIKCAVWFDGDGHSRPGDTPRLSERLC